MPTQAVPAQDAARARPLTILYVEQNVDGTTGGSYRSLLYLLKGLDKNVYSPIVAFYREHELLADYQAAGCRTMILSHPRAMDLASPVLRLGAVGRALAPLARVVQKAWNLVWVSGSQLVRGLVLLRRQRVDVLDLNNGVTVGTELLVASKLLGIPCVIHQRGITHVPRWCAWLTRHADHVICVSDAARDNLVAHGLLPERVTAVHSGINPEELRRKIRRTPRQVRASLGIPDSALVVGLAGMIRLWKGQMVLVKAMAGLHRQHPHVHALIMGGVSDNDPSDRAYLEEIRAYMATHDLDKCITLLDYQPNAPEFLQIFDVMVHTAIDPEPFSRVVIEGMALGRPIVASATGGTPEAVEDGITGFLVPAGDADALADRIALLIQQPELRATLGSAALARVETRFHIDRHVGRTQDIYAALSRTI
jgi:glycosyltransferase involved in cell wall biosynthesis